MTTSASNQKFLTYYDTLSNRLKESFHIIPQWISNQFVNIEVSTGRLSERLKNNLSDNQVDTVFSVW